MFSYYKSGAWEDVMGYPMEWDEEIAQSLQAHIDKLLVEARLGELIKLKNAHTINIFDEYLESRINKLKGKS